MPSPKKKKNQNRPQKNPIQTLRLNYDTATDKVAELIGLVAALYQDEKLNGGLIAQWGLAYAHEDLVKLYHRLGNLKFTTRKGKK